MVHTQPLFLGAGLQACGGSASVHTDPCSSGRQGGSWIQLSASPSCRGWVSAATMGYRESHGINSPEVSTGS
jgi:hypothetical protein